jgi:hypothetical protein
MSIAKAKPIAPAIKTDPIGFSCTVLAMACDPSRTVSPLLP